MMTRLQSLKDTYNSITDMPEDRKAVNEFQIFQKWHDIHFQYEEHWKFAGLTHKRNLNPVYYKKVSFLVGLQRFLDPWRTRRLKISCVVWLSEWPQCKLALECAGLAKIECSPRFLALFHLAERRRRQASFRWVEKEGAEVLLWEPSEERESCWLTCVVLRRPIPSVERQNPS